MLLYTGKPKKKKTLKSSIINLLVIVGQERQLDQDGSVIVVRKKGSFLFDLISIYRRLPTE